MGPVDLFFAFRSLSFFVRFFSALRACFAFAARAPSWPERLYGNVFFFFFLPSSLFSRSWGLRPVRRDTAQRRRVCRGRHAFPFRSGRHPFSRPGSASRPRHEIAVEPLFTQ